MPDWRENKSEGAYEFGAAYPMQKKGRLCWTFSVSARANSLSKVIHFKRFLLVFRTMRLHASLAGNMFSTQKLLAEETTYKHSWKLFFKFIRKSLERSVCYSCSYSRKKGPHYGEMLIIIPKEKWPVIVTALFPKNNGHIHYSIIPLPPPRTSSFSFQYSCALKTPASVRKIVCPFSLQKV